VGALVSLKLRQKKMRLFPSEIINCQAYPRLQSIKTQGVILKI
jgi:hypothetical protein